MPKNSFRYCEITKKDKKGIFRKIGWQKKNCIKSGLITFQTKIQIKKLTTAKMVLHLKTYFLTEENKNCKILNLFLQLHQPKASV